VVRGHNWGNKVVVANETDKQKVKLESMVIWGTC